MIKFVSRTFANQQKISTAELWCIAGCLFAALSYLEGRPELEGALVDNKIVVPGPGVLLDGFLFLHIVVVIMRVVVVIVHHASAFASLRLLVVLQASLISGKSYIVLKPLENDRAAINTSISWRSPAWGFPLLLWGSSLLSSRPQLPRKTPNNKILHRNNQTSSHDH